MNTLLCLLHKEFLQIFRSGFLPRLIIVFPVMIMCVMPWVMNMEVKNIRVDIVDEDRSPLSGQMRLRIEQSRYFKFNRLCRSYTEARADIEASRADVVLHIPPHYSRDLVKGLHPKIFLAANTTNSTKGAMGVAYLSQITVRQLAGLSPQDVVDSTVSTLNLYNIHQDYKVFMIPALTGILIILFCGFLPTLNIVSEKERGTIEQMNVTPVKKGTFILSKLIPYFIIALAVMSVCFVLSWLVYGITSQGPLTLVFLVSVLLALVFSGLGLTISNYSDTMQQAIFVMWFIIMCFMLLSGIFSPVRSMPLWAQHIVTLNPMHYFIDAVRTVFVRGGGWTSIRHEVLALAIFALATDSLAVWSYRKNR